MKSKIFVLNAIIIILFSNISINAEASDSVNISNFDYVRYADSYPDLQTAYGYDSKALYNHYMNLGRAEGRLGVRTRASYLPQSYFDSSRYASENPDVAAAVGSSKAKLYNHYVAFGQYEGRSAWSTDAQINAKLKAYDVVVSSTNGSMSEYERIKAVHDWMVKNVRYNITAYNTNNYSDSDYSAVGPMLLGTGVCSGYSESFAICMDIMGIDNRRPYSNNHSWNEVKLSDGRYLSVDVCWDDPVPDNGYSVYWYKYFLISQEEMAREDSHSIIGYY